MWRKTLVILAGAVFIIMVFQLFFRYKIVKVERTHGAALLYLFDRLTGQLSDLESQEEIKPDKEAVKLVKNLPRFARLGTGNVGDRIHQQLSRMIGDAEFKGWNAKEVGNNVYLVGCTYLQNGKEQGWWWEVNLNMNIVRPIISSWEYIQIFPYGKNDDKNDWIIEIKEEDIELAKKYKLLILKDLKSTKVLSDSISKK